MGKRLRTRVGQKCRSGRTRRDAGSLGMGGVDESEQLGNRRTGGYEERMRRDGHSVGHTARRLSLLLLRRFRLIVTETE